MWNVENAPRRPLYNFSSTEQSMNWNKKSVISTSEWKGGGVIQHQTMEIDIRKEYYKWVRLVFRRELNVEKESRTLTSLLYHWWLTAITVLIGSEIREMDTKTRKLFTMHRMHHPKADVEAMRTTRSRGQGSTIDNWNWNIWQQRLAFKCTLNTILITWCSWFTNIIKRRSCTQLWMRASSLDLTWIYPLVQKGFTQQQTSEHAMKKIQAKRTELVKLEEK